MKLYKAYAKEPFSFLVKDRNLLSYNSFDLGRTYHEMSIGEKIKAFNKKIEQNKAQYNLDI